MGLRDELKRKSKLWLFHRFHGPFHADPVYAFEACIFKLDRIGDFVLALGAIRQLLKSFGETKCLLIISPFAREIAEKEFPNTPKIVLSAYSTVISPDFLRFLARERRLLGRYRFKRLISLRHHRSMYHDIILSWIIADESYGVTDLNLYSIPEEAAITGHRFAYQIDYPTEFLGGTCRELAAHKKLIKVVLSSAVNQADVLPSFKNIRSFSSGYIMVSPSSSSILRDYPTRRLSHAIQIAQHSLHCPIRICVASSDVRLGRKLASEAHSYGAKDLEVQVTKTVGEFIDVCANAGAILTMESAAAHVGAALDKSTVVVLGGGHYGIFAPWCRSTKQKWLSCQMPCFNCNWKCINSEVSCITRISSEEIARALLNVWNIG